MTQINPAELTDGPMHYQSSRALNDVLVSEDTALPLIEASSSGNLTADMLSQPDWSKFALEKPHWIYSQNRARKDENDVRTVTAMRYLNLSRALIKAAENGHASAVTILLEFASQQGLKPSSVNNRWAIDKAIRNGHAAVIEALLLADPSFVNGSLGDSTQPLDLAVQKYKTELVEVLLRYGANPRPNAPASSSKRTRSYKCSLLSNSVVPQGTRMTESLLKYGVSPDRSGALHLAAELGRLDTIRLLIEHNADVNERLSEDTLPGFVDRPLFASRTPMHFAASTGQVEAMEILEKNGGQLDAKDRDGKTPAKLLEESK